MKAVTILLVSVFTGFSATNAQSLFNSVTIDLNSDGKKDTVKIERSGYENGFRLMINDKETLGRSDAGFADGFMITDLDSKDEFKEIVVHAQGQGDDESDQEYLVYWYNGAQVFMFDHFTGGVTFKGNGIIYVDNWQGFWTCRDKYIVDRNHTCTWVQQPAYYVGVNATVKTGFIIYADTELVKKVASLTPGSEIVLLLCDKTNRSYDEYRYLIRSSAGLLGWADFQTIQVNTEGLPYAD